ncbi:MAG: CBS domain-containing protein [Ignisphaera sp.]
MSVKDIMRTEVVTASTKASIEDVAKIMSEKNIGSILIVDESNRVIGIFAERDLVKVVALGIDINTPIKNVMTTNVISAYPTDNIAAIAIKMLEKGIRHMPVVDEYNRLLGIISIRDVLRAYTAGCEFP